MPGSCDVRKNPALTMAKAMVQWVKRTVSRCLRPLFSVCGDPVAAAVLLAIVMIGLFWTNIHPAGPTQGEEHEESPGGTGIIIRSEVIDLWLPESLRELARTPSQIPQDHNDFRRSLEQRHKQGLRTAVTIRGHQVNGGYVDIHFIRNPSENPDHFRELLNALTGVGGTSGRDQAANSRSAEIHFVPDELLDREPSEILDGLKRFRDDRR